MEAPNPDNKSKQRTGYEITLSDFRELISCPPYQADTRDWLRHWLGYDIRGASENAVVTDSEGRTIDMDELHAKIQSDPRKQNSIYNLAMTLWH